MAILDTLPSQSRQLFCLTITAYRKPGLSEAAYREYMTKTHAPLVSSLMKEYGIIRYNMLYDPEFSKLSGYDCIIQFVFRHMEDFRRMKADPRFLEKVAPDHKNFADTSRSTMTIGYFEEFLDNGDAMGQNSWTVSGPPATVQHFLESSQFAETLKFTPLAVHAPYHAPHIFSVRDVEHILQGVGSVSDQSSKISFISSSASRNDPNKSKFRDLLYNVVKSILILPLDLREAAENIQQALETADARGQCALFPISTSVCPSLKLLFSPSLLKRVVVVDSIMESIAAGAGVKPSDAVKPGDAKIAIIGMSGRFPEAEDIEAFWALLYQGLDVHRPVPEDRYNAELYYDATGKRKNTSKVTHGCWINEPGLFDAKFFNISPKEAEQSDPGQRLALTTAYEALEMAGVVADRTPSTQRDRVGVFYGMTSDDYREVSCGQNVDTYFIPGNCNTFDDEADGYCRADAVGTVVLKRLEDAITEHDPILGVILGAHTNHSADSVSITRPHCGAQEEIFSKLLTESGIHPHQVSYIEMHGTGTQAGDATEMASVLNSFAPSTSQGRQPHESLHLGSTKANVGHSESASGVTALIKVLLMMQKNIIPPHCGIKGRINHKFPTDLKDRNVHIARIPTAWTRRGEFNNIRRAFVNNFSAAGGNTALLVEDYAELTMRSSLPDPRTAHLVTISAKSIPSLKGNIEKLRSFVQQKSPTKGFLCKLSYTTTARRMHHPFRVAIPAANCEQLLSALNEEAKRDNHRRSSEAPVAFVFSGQGSQYSAIGQHLLHFATFRDEINSYDILVQRHGFPSIIPLVDGSIKIEDLEPLVVQLGITLGHYAALKVAGVLTASDTLYLVDDIESLSQQLVDKSVTATRINVPFAFHSTQVDPVLDELEVIASQAGHIKRHCREAVNFRDILRSAKGDGLISEKTIWIELGSSIIWDEYHHDFEGCKEVLRLPAYSWDNKNYCSSVSAYFYFLNCLMVHGHVVNGNRVCTSSLYTDFGVTLGVYILERYRQDLKDHAVDIQDMIVYKALVHKDGPPMVLRININHDMTDSKAASMSIYSVDSNGNKTVDHAQSRLYFEQPKVWLNNWDSTQYYVERSIEWLKEKADQGLNSRLSSGVIYKLFSSLVDYSNAYKGMQEAIVNAEDYEATSLVRFQVDEGNFQCNPMWVDSCGQLAGFLMNGHSKTPKDHVFINHGWKSFRTVRKFRKDKTYRTYVRMRPIEGTTYAGDVYIFDDKVPRYSSEDIEYRDATTKISPPSRFAGPSNIEPLKLDAALKSASAASAARDPMQAVLKIVSEEIGIPSASVQDDLIFADYGVDSLLSLTISGRLREELELEIESSVFETCATLADFVAHLSLNNSSSDQSSEQLSVFESISPTSEPFGAMASNATTPPSRSVKEPVSNSLCKDVCAILAEEIGVSTTEIANNANLGEMGMDSLMSLTVLGRLREELELELDDDFFVTHPDFSSFKLFFQPDHGHGIEPEPSAELKQYRATSTLLQGSPKSAHYTLFLFPDGSGSATSYAPINLVGKDVCVYGLNCPWLKSAEKLVQFGLNGLASLYLEEIRRRVPHGPYNLGGWSAGGICAYEAAIQFTREGETVERLILLDSPNPIGLEKLPARLFDFINGLGLFGDGKAPDWLLAHFLAFIDALDEWKPVPWDKALGSKASPPKTYILWAEDGVCKGTDARPEYTGNDPREMQWLLENRTNFGGNNWDVLLER
ncbi:conidial pigment polyketide synthase PksP/Alb1 [Trichoderma cornu-damae]|uniref:Conidial pigment polyketide synthase PksP/Alb1 n=1 Tax=Trichoderma cornu-damae TaxID=654480 RepID=A0A9P8QP65_9HYPO|nr:conidial pigment polyketide synthase PksP/Alb1 [Trichoderma cornu-damae]